MQKKILVVFLTVAIPGLVLAQGSTSYQCTYGDLQRRVEILTDPGVSVPCEVHYYKDTEAPGERQVLWSATAEEGYCERKTEEFVTKLKGWGWQCGPGAPAEEAAAPAPEGAAEAAAEAGRDAPEADDTEALEPAE